MEVKLENTLIKVTIDTFGAELKEITDVRTGRQFLYDGSTQFWKNRRSPVLFPIVGSVWEGRYRMDGKEYHLGQHGFARDSEFTVIEDSPEDEAWFKLESSEETLAKYPRRFRLEVGYKLDGERLTIGWRVVNTGDREMAFQIGAHPAFLYPDFNKDDEIHGYISLGKDSVETRLLGEKGAVKEETMTIVMDSEGMLPITPHTFDINTIILEKQVNRVSLLDKERKPYVSVLFRAPVVGIWSPSPEAPFICLEPWYGRCDRINYEGEFEDRDYVNKIQPGETFEAGYMVIFENV